MPVLIGRVIPILRPLLQLPEPAHPWRQQPGTRLLDLFAKFAVAFQRFRGRNAVVEKIPHDGHVHGAAA